MTLGNLIETAVLALRDEDQWTKDVKAEITITSAKKVTRQDAVRMIVEQLRLVFDVVL